MLVFIDLDEAYLTALERKFVEELGKFANISIITDMCYFSEYFSIPREIDILVVNEQLYDAQLSNHSIGITYILTENPVDNAKNNNYNYIYKYTSVQEIFTQISNNEIIRGVSGGALGKNNKLILMHSPIGGVGTTTLGLGIANVLKHMGYKVLFVSMENLQSFGNYFGESKFLPDDFDKKFNTGAVTFDVIKSEIVEDEIDYIPPVKTTLEAMGISENKYIEMIRNIKSLGEYDYIFVDTDSVFNKNIISFMNEVDQVIILVEQYKRACQKLSKFVYNISGVSSEKLLFICNKYNDQKENELINYNGMIYVSDYVYYDENIFDADLKELLNSGDILRISQYVYNLT